MEDLAAVPVPLPGSEEAHARFYADYLRHRRQEVRHGAMFALCRIGTGGATPAVVEAVTTAMDEYANDERFVASALDALAQYGRLAQSAITAVVRVLCSSTDLAPLAASALLAFGSLGISALLDVVVAGSSAGNETMLLSQLANHVSIARVVLAPVLQKECSHADPNRRHSATRALGLLRECGVSATPIIGTLLCSGAVDRDVAASALRAMGPRGEAELALLARSDTNARVRASAARALGNDRRPTGPLVPIIARPAALPGTGSPFVFGEDAQGNVVSIEVDARLLIAGTRRAVATGEFELDLQETFHEDPEAQLSHSALLALEACISDPAAIVREAAILALGTLGLPFAEGTQCSLVALLRDADQQVRAAAAEALGNLGTPTPSDAVPCLSAMLRDGYWRVRHCACIALGRLGEVASSAVPQLIKVLREGSVNRQNTAAALAACGNEGVEALLAIVREPARASVQVRISAVYGLSVVDPGATIADVVVQALFDASKDRDAPMRRAVLEALGNLGKNIRQASPLLKPGALLPFTYTYLRDKEALVREAAAETLASAGAHGELLLIEGILKDSNPTCRCACAHGLASVGASLFRTLLLALTDREHIVRQASAACVEKLGPTALVAEWSQRPKSQRESVVLAAKDVLQSPYPFSQALLHLRNGHSFVTMFTLAS
eukprot:TRINITY_DN6629_c0_g3_i2.p1 TRINITY_DN6629_c0_g3~~TRINITY_DN6629_c0_g3_i2.p1  ORF type:complete len:672 (-),score=98.43 TRINITY_DN6629_c0_g3_i2:1567-3582(-)